MRQARKRTRYSVLRGGACDGAIRWLKDDARSTRDIAQTVLGLLCSSSLRGRPPSTGEHGRTNFSASIAAMDRLLCRWPRCLGKGKNVRHYLYIVADAQRSGDAVPLVFDIERSNGRGRVRTMHARKLWLPRSGSQSCEAQGDLIMPSTKIVASLGMLLAVHIYRPPASLARLLSILCRTVRCSVPLFESCNPLSSPVNRPNKDHDIL